MSCGAPLAGPSPLVPPQPRPKGYHSLDHSIDPYSVPAGRLLAGQKSVVLQCRNCGSLGEHLPSGPRVQAGARCTCPCVKVTERVLYLCHHAGHPRSCSRRERDRERESPARVGQSQKTKYFVSNTTMQHATDRHATQHTRTTRTFATHSPHAPVNLDTAHAPQGVGDVTSGLTFM